MLDEHKEHMQTILGGAIIAYLESCEVSYDEEGRIIRYTVPRQIPSSVPALVNEIAFGKTIHHNIRIAYWKRHINQHSTIPDYTDIELHKQEYKESTKSSDRQRSEYNTQDAQVIT